MHTHRFILAAGAVLVASQASIAAPPVPYSLHAIHADLQEQLDQAGNINGTVGQAARTAAHLLAAHNESQERAVLPLLRTGPDSRPPASTTRNSPNQPEPPDAAMDLIAALADLYAIAGEADRADVSRIAERLIWHEMTDIEIVLPALALVNPDEQRQRISPAHTAAPGTTGALYGSETTPLMGVGNPHAAGASK